MLASNGSDNCARVWRAGELASVTVELELDCNGGAGFDGVIRRRVDAVGSCSGIYASYSDTASC